MDLMVKKISLYTKDLTKRDRHRTKSTRITIKNFLSTKFKLLLKNFQMSTKRKSYYESRFIDS